MTIQEKININMFKDLISCDENVMAVTKSINKKIQQYMHSDPVYGHLVILPAKKGSEIDRPFIFGRVSEEFFNNDNHFPKDSAEFFWKTLCDINEINISNEAVEQSSIDPQEFFHGIDDIYIILIPEDMLDWLLSDPDKGFSVEMHSLLFIIQIIGMAIEYESNDYHGPTLYHASQICARVAVISCMASCFLAQNGYLSKEFSLAIFENTFSIMASLSNLDITDVQNKTAYNIHGGLNNILERISLNIKNCYSDVDVAEIDIRCVEHIIKKWCVNGITPTIYDMNNIEHVTGSGINPNDLCDLSGMIATYKYIEQRVYSLNY